jgi:hypothetical protein
MSTLKEIIFQIVFWSLAILLIVKADEWPFHILVFGYALGMALLLIGEIDKFKIWNELPYWYKVWLRCLIIASTGVFIGALVGLIAYILGIYEP